MWSCPRKGVMTISANVTGLGTGGGGPFVVRCRVVRLRHILNKVITLRNPCPVLLTLHQHLAKLAFGSYFDSVRGGELIDAIADRIIEFDGGRIVGDRRS